MEFQLLESTNIVTVVSYVITVVIGGVGYKFIDRYLTHKKDSDEHNSVANKLLFDSMFAQITSLNGRIAALESEREKYHLREVAVSQELASARTEVNFLKDKLKTLETNQQDLVTKLEFYEKKYGAK